MRLVKLGAGDGVTISIRDEISLKLKPGTGATMTYSEVDDSDADEHSADTTDVTDDTSITPEWPHYRISVAGGDGVVGVI